MRTQFIIAACLAFAATGAFAQARIGSSAVGSLGGNGAVTDFGARPLDPRTPDPATPRTEAPSAASAPAPRAPTNGGLDQAAAPASRPIVDGAVWGSPSNQTPAQNSGSANQ